MEQFEESLRPLLRPQQIEEMHDEKQRLERTLDAPPHVVSQVQDVGAMRRQLRQLNAQLEHQTPRPYKQDEIDKAVVREEKLRGEFTAGMPTQAEMRKTPTGAVDKHMAWERRNKRNIMEWKNIRLRLQASGGISGMTDGRDVANIERFRPTGGSGELPMHAPLISGKDIHIPPKVEIKNVAPETEKERWAKETVALVEKLAEEGDPRYVKLLTELQQAHLPQVKRGPGRPRKEV